MINNNTGLFSEPSLKIFSKGANNSDPNCTYLLTDDTIVKIFPVHSDPHKQLDVLCMPGK